MQAFLRHIDDALHKHMPIHAQGPLVANALSMTFQFQMAIWRMVGEECVRPVRAKHSDWCGLAGIVQAIVETFPQNCMLMFPPAPPVAPVPQASFSATFSSTFWPTSSEDGDDDDDDTVGVGGDFPRFGTSTPTLSGSRRGSTAMFSDTLSFASNALPNGGAFTMVSDNAGGPSGTSLAEVAGTCTSGPHAGGLDLGEEADDEDDLDKGGSKDMTGDSMLDPDEMAILQGIIPNLHLEGHPPAVLKSGDKRGAAHFEGGSGSSESSAEDLDAVHPPPRVAKKGGTPTKTNSPDQWSAADVNVVWQAQYKTDFQHFRTYHDFSSR